MQNYDGQFKLNGQEYFYRAKDLRQKNRYKSFVHHSSLQIQCNL